MQIREVSGTLRGWNKSTTSQNLELRSIVTQNKFARDNINNLRILHSEAIFTKYRLAELIKKLNDNELVLDDNIKKQKKTIIKELNNLILTLEKNNSIHIENSGHNVCLIEYDFISLILVLE